MSPGLRSFLSGTVGLSLLLGIAALLTVARPRVGGEAALRSRFTWIAAGAIAAQLLHFAEELGTGFHRLFPSGLGLEPWSGPLFAGFNLSWLAVWVVAAVAVRAGVVLALWPLWFLGLAGVVNGVAHPFLALRAAGYFPGLVTAPLVAGAGAALLHQLWTLTGRGSAGRDP